MPKLKDTDSQGDLFKTDIKDLDAAALTNAGLNLDVAALDSVDDVNQPGVLDLMKAVGHKYKRRKKVRGKWVYDYGLGWGVTPQLDLFTKRPKAKAKTEIKPPPPEAPIPELHAALPPAVKINTKLIGELLTDDHPDAQEAVKLFLDYADTPRAKTGRKNSLKKLGIKKTRSGWVFTKVEPKTKPKKETKTAVSPKTKRPPAKKAPPKKRASKSAKELVEVGEHVYGSRKDLAAIAQELQAGTRELTGEELGKLDPADAAYMVTKQNLLQIRPHADLKAAGKSPGAAHMELAILAAVRAKPARDTAEGRRQYLDDVRLVQGSLKKCMTSEDVGQLITEWRDKRRSVGERETVHSTTNLSEAKDKAAELTKKAGQVHDVRRRGFSGSYLVTTKSIQPFDVLGKTFTGMLSYSRSKRRFGNKHFIDASRVAYTADKVEGGETSRKNRDGTTTEFTDGWDYLATLGAAIGDVKEEKRKHQEAVKKKRGASGQGQTSRGISTAKVVSGEVKRKGGKDIRTANPERVKKTFGLTNVQYGKYLTQADREYHTKAFEGAMHDFSEILGFDPKTVSLNGRLAIAMGARGRGSFAAHYESHKKIINLTKFSGGGSVAHEWGHALDNILAEHFTKESSSHGTYLSDQRDNDTIPADLRGAMHEVWEAITKNPDPVEGLRKKKEGMEKWGAEMRKLTKQNNELVREHGKLSAKVPPDQVEYQIARAQKQVDLHRAGGGSFSYWEQKRDALVSGENVRQPEDSARMKELSFEVDVLRGPLNHAVAWVKHWRSYDPALSDLFQTSKKAGKYWSAPWELFARSFESHVEDKLKKAGRQNTYLVDGTNQGGVYPAGAERVQIGKAMDSLMAHLSKTGLLTKAFATITGAGLAEPTGYVLEPVNAVLSL